MDSCSRLAIFLDAKFAYGRLTTTSNRIIDPPLVGRGTQTRLVFPWVCCTHLKMTRACNPRMRNLWNRGIYTLLLSRVRMYTLMIFLPSVRTRVRLPTISVGKTRSSKILSWTLVNVRDMGRGCFWRLLRPGLRMIRRWPINTTWRSENFFSSSRVNLKFEVSQSPEYEKGKIKVAKQK